jgi:hypothetical protein
MENDPSSQLLAEQLKHLNTLYKALMNAPVGWVAFSTHHKSYDFSNLLELF